MRSIYSVCTIPLLLFFSGCNSDLFVDAIPDMVSEITLSGNVDSYVVKIPRKGLQGVSFGNNLDYLASEVYYDLSGEEIYSFSSIDEISKVVYLSPRFQIEFVISGDEVKIIAWDNTFDEVLKVDISLRYGYESKVMTVNVAPGDPARIDHLGYDILRPVSGFRTEQGMRQRFTNNSSLTQHLIVYPYKDSKSKITFTPEDSWQYGIRGIVSVPIYKDGEWVETASSQLDVMLGTTESFYSENINVDEEVIIDVSPNSTVAVDTYVRYATLDVGYLGSVVLPNSNNMMMISGRCSLSQPIDYKIEVICED